jgi:hypothetical protein
MFGKKSLPIGVMVMILIVALGSLGVVYGLWSESLFVSGTVATGQVDVAFSPCTTNDTGIDPGYDKDVADCLCELTGPDKDSTCDTGPDKMTISIIDGYPSYTCEVKYDIENVGTVPVMLQEILFAADPTLTVTQDCVDKGYQLDPSCPIDCKITIHVEQWADEHSHYGFSKSYKWVQWNEYVP